MVHKLHCQQFQRRELIFRIFVGRQMIGVMKQWAARITSLLMWGKMLLSMSQPIFGMDQLVTQLKYMVLNLLTIQKSENSQFAKESKPLEMEQTTLLTEHTTIL